MKRNSLFLDSSAVIAGVISGEGAARVLLLLGEAQKIALTVSEQVVIEVERNLARKAPKLLSLARQMFLQANMMIVKDPTPESVSGHLFWISHAADVPILVAAVQARVEYLVTLNRRHFLADPGVAQRTGLLIGTPGDALGWIRGQWLKES